MVIDHDDSAAIGHEPAYSPLSGAPIDRPSHVPYREHSLDLDAHELPFVGSRAGMDRPHEAPKPDGLLKIGRLA